MTSLPSYGMVQSELPLLVVAVPPGENEYRGIQNSHLDVAE